MAEKKIPAKKATATTNKRTSTSRKKKSAKPKVTLSARKVYILCAIIVCICGLSLALSVITAAPIEANETSPLSLGIATPAAEVEAPNAQKSSAQASPAAQAVAVQKESATVAVKPLSATEKKAPARKETSASAAKKTSAASAVKAEKATAKVAPAAHSSAPATAKQTPATPAPTPATGAPAASAASPVASQAPSAPQAPAAATSAPAAVTARAPEAATATIPAPKSDKAVASIKPDLSTKPQPKSATAQKPAPAPQVEPFTIPPAKNGATLVFVIDDAGLHVENVRRYTALPFPITIAVLPKLSETKQCAAQIRADGKELMLHQPMQAENLSINPGAGKISPDMTSYEVAAQIKENLAELGGGVKGFNNHEGSLITGDIIKMGAVLETAASAGVYFLDSRTTAASQARQAALERDMHIFERNAPFLDNAVSRDEMLSEIYKGLAVANKAGYAIIIGHVDKSVDILPKLLEEMYPYLVKKGYRFATPSTL